MKSKTRKAAGKASLDPLVRNLCDRLEETTKRMIRNCGERPGSHAAGTACQFCTAYADGNRKAIVIANQVLSK